jgi:hypothetical protein
LLHAPLRQSSEGRRDILLVTVLDELHWTSVHGGDRFI